jgi:hypothetical protein
MGELIENRAVIRHFRRVHEKRAWGRVGVYNQFSFEGIKTGQQTEVRIRKRAMALNQR